MPPRHPSIKQLVRATRFVCTQCRYAHTAPTKLVPNTTPFVPDAQTFLTLIGRGLSQHAAKIPSWDALFTMSSEQLREAGVEPARARRYLLWWRDRYRAGIMGIGGDLKEVTNGVAELRVVQVKSDREGDRAVTLTRDPGTRKVIANVPLTVAGVADEASTDEQKTLPTGLAPLPTMDAADVHTIAGLSLVQGNSIGGRGIEYIKGYDGVARLKVAEGLWEERRGHKVDGGERRKAEVRFKRAQAERKAR